MTTVQVDLERPIAKELMSKLQDHSRNSPVGSRAPSSVPDKYRRNYKLLESSGPDFRSSVRKPKVRESYVVRERELPGSLDKEFAPLKFMNISSAQGNLGKSTHPRTFSSSARQDQALRL
jgi:hypothetical protein